MTTLRLDGGHVQRFATASGDTNPLHVDAGFARRTMYGQCIAHGALVAIVALGAGDGSALRRARSLDLRFTRPVFPGEDVSVRAVLSTAVLSTPERNPMAARVTVEAWTRGQLATQVAVEVGADELGAAPDWAQAGRAAPRRLTVAELEASAGAEHGEAYGPDLAGLRELAAELGAGEVPDALLGWLAAASYTVGMLVPGADAVFGSGHVERAEPGGADRPGGIDATASPPQPGTGLLQVRARLRYGAASAQMKLRAFVRTEIPGPRRDVLGEHLPPSQALRGRNVLVVGASRGMGAAVAGALATQGATVWAGFASSTGPIEELRREFGAERVRPVQFDAADAMATRSAIGQVVAAAGGLDGVVLCAAPPLQAVPLHPEAAPIALAHVNSSVAMVLHPLAEALPNVTPGGWLVFVSSSAIADPPVDWPHYVAAKGAVEALAAYCRKHTGLQVAMIRPPRMRTDMTNGPTGAIGTMAPEAVAAAVVRWVLNPGEVSTRSAGCHLIEESVCG